jgi:glycine reductase
MGGNGKLKKIILILNHVQAGMGSDEQANLEPAGKKGAIGPGRTLAPYFQEHGCIIVATLYCGDDYFLSNEVEVTKKFIGISKKFGADGVLCGPAMQYAKFGEMACKLAQSFNSVGIPAAAAMAIENEAVELYKEEVPIIKMPKKGGIGLNRSFKNMAIFVSALAKHEETTELRKEICF